MADAPPSNAWAEVARVLLAAAGVVVLVWGSSQRAKVQEGKRKRLGR